MTNTANVSIFAKKLLMKQLTLSGVFARYPLKASRIAISLGRSREWITRLSTAPAQTAEIHRANVMVVQQYLRTIGAELSGIVLTAGNSGPDAVNIQEFFTRYPFTVLGIAKYQGVSREWLSSIIQGRYRASESARLRQIAKLQQLFREIGNDLKDINLIP